MSWFMVLIPTIDALAAKRRLTATTKHLQKDQREGRDRDQLRADLASAWLRGVGTQTAVKTKIFVTVPVGALTGALTGAGGRCATCGGSGLPEQARVVGGEAIDPVSAAQLLSTPSRSGASTSTRSRRRRRSRPAPLPAHRLAAGLADPAARHLQSGWLRASGARGGHRRAGMVAGSADEPGTTPTALTADHTRRHSTRLRYRSRADGSDRVETPTGCRSQAPPPF